MLRISIGAVIFVVTLASGIYILTPKDRVVSLVIPHHDMEASVREAFLQEIKHKVSPTTHILISPDHFNGAHHPLVTTDRIWDTKDGIILPCVDLIKGSGIPLNDAAFNGEHGIGNVIGPLKRAFPESTIVPILAKRSATYGEMNSLVTRLNELCPECLLVASVDFSHVKNTNEARSHDEVTLRVLHDVDSVDAYKHAHADSPEALVALIEWARLHGAESFTLYEHTNSGELTHTEEGEITTHIFGAFTTK